MRDGMKFIKSNLSVGKYCSQFCNHCPSSRRYSKEVDFKSRTDIEEIIRKIKLSNSVNAKHHVVITGGEPFDNPNILEIIDYLTGVVDFLTISTNGLKLINDPELRRSFCKTKVQELSLSTDYTAERYLKIRGSDNYNGLRKLVLLLRCLKEDLLISANIVLESKSYPLVGEILEHFDQSNFDIIKFIPFREFENSSVDKFLVQPLTNTQYLELKKKILTFKSSSNKRFYMLGKGFEDQYNLN